MKEELIKFWQTKSNFNFKEDIGNIEDSCCWKFYRKILDYEAVRKKFWDELGLKQEISSVDAIILNKKKNLCLIEMKGFDGTKSLAEFGEENIKNIKPKFVDTVITLISILGYRGMKKNLFAPVLNTRQLKILPYLVCNITAKEAQFLNEAFKDELNIRISSRIVHPIQVLTCEDFLEVFPN